MNEIVRYYVRKVRTQTSGYTLLEYCAGAALIAGVIWTAMGLFGASISTFLDTLRLWVTERQSDLIVSSS